MAKRYSVHEALEFIFDCDNDQEEADSAETLEEEVSETEDDTTQRRKTLTPMRKKTQLKLRSPFRSINRTFSWMPSPPERRGWLSSEDVIIMTPGPTQYAISWVLFSTFPQGLLWNNCHEHDKPGGGKGLWRCLEGGRPDEYWNLHGCVDFVWCLTNESASSVWDTGWEIFSATMSLQTFHILSRVIHSDDSRTRAPIREIWLK